MLQEALEKVEEMAQAEMTPKAPAVFTVDGVPHKVFYADARRDIRDFDVPPDPRWHTFTDLEDLVAAGKAYNANNIWIGDTSIVALLDDATYRENKLVFPLAVSKPLRWVEANCGEHVKMFKQADFIRALRTDMAKSIDPTLLGQVRVMKFSSNSQAEGAITQGRESMGRQIERTITGAGDLPEKVLISVPVYDQLPKPLFSIECVLVVDTALETFGLQALPGEVLTAYQGAQAQLRQLIAQAQGEHDTEFPVYAGTP